MKDMFNLKMSNSLLRCQQDKYNRHLEIAQKTTSSLKPVQDKTRRHKVCWKNHLIVVYLLFHRILGDGNQCSGTASGKKAAHYFPIILSQEATQSLTL